MIDRPQMCLRQFINTVVISTWLRLGNDGSANCIVATYAHTCKANNTGIAYESTKDVQNAIAHVDCSWCILDIGAYYIQAHCTYSMSSASQDFKWPSYACRAHVTSTSDHTCICPSMTHCAKLASTVNSGVALTIP